jgi:hypothetical protein
MLHRSDIGTERSAAQIVECRCFGAGGGGGDDGHEIVQHGKALCLAERDQTDANGNECGGEGLEVGEEGGAAIDVRRVTKAAGGDGIGGGMALCA